MPRSASPSSTFSRALRKGVRPGSWPMTATWSRRSAARASRSRSASARPKTAISPGVRLDDAREQMEQGGLARPGRARDRDQLARAKEASSPARTTRFCAPCPYDFRRPRTSATDRPSAVALEPRVARPRRPRRAAGPAERHDDPARPPARPGRDPRYPRAPAAPRAAEAIRRAPPRGSPRLLALLPRSLARRGRERSDLRSRWTRRHG